MIHRRSFLAGLGAMLAAPAVVHAGNLMPVRPIDRLFRPTWSLFQVGDLLTIDANGTWRKINELVTERVYGVVTGTKPDVSEVRCFGEMQNALIDCRYGGGGFETRMLLVDMSQSDEHRRHQVLQREMTIKIPTNQVRA